MSRHTGSGTFGICGLLLLLTAGLMLAGCPGNNQIETPPGGTVSGGGQTETPAPGEAAVDVVSPLVGTWFLEGEWDGGAALLPDFVLRGDGTMALLDPDIDLGGEGGRASWQAADGRLTLVITVSHDEGKSQATVAVTFNYTLSDSTLTLAHASVDGGATYGSATYHKDRPVASVVKAIAPEETASQTRQAAVEHQVTAVSQAATKPAAKASADVHPLVGVWVAAETNKRNFPPDFELRVDGTLALLNEAGEDARLTWKTEGTSLIISMVEPSRDPDEIPATGTITYDYTLSDLTLTLSNGRAVLVKGGQARNETEEGQATYSRSDGPPADDDDVDVDDGDVPAEATTETRQTAETPTFAQTLVGTWTTTEEDNTGYFPPTIVLNADGTFTFTEYFDDEEDVTLTWSAEGDSLIFLVVSRFLDAGKVEVLTDTLTLDYTLSGSALTLFNGRGTHAGGGDEVATETFEGQATYTRSGDPPADEDADEDDDDAAAGAIQAEAASDTAGPTADVHPLVGVWTTAKEDNDTNNFPSSFALHADGTFTLPDETIPDKYDANLTWSTEGGCLILLVNVRSSVTGEAVDLTTATYDYTLSDSTLTLSNGRATIVRDGETRNETDEGQATYTKRDGQPTDDDADDDNVGATEASASIEAAEATSATRQAAVELQIAAVSKTTTKPSDAAEPPTGAKALVGTWILTESDDEMDFLPNCELRADGTVIFVDPEQFDADSEGSVTWEVVGDSMIFSVIAREKGTDNIRFQSTVTYDYTLSGSTLTLSNGRAVLTYGGQTRNETTEGQATYTRGDGQSADDGEEDVDGGAAAGSSQSATEPSDADESSADVHPLVGMWVLTDGNGDLDFPPGIELRADGTLSIPEFEDDDIDDEVSTTWETEGDSVIITFIARSRDTGEIEYTEKITFDYMLSGSKLTLFNGRDMVIIHGEVSNSTIEGQATYEKSDGLSVDEDEGG